MTFFLAVGGFQKEKNRNSKSGRGRNQGEAGLCEVQHRPVGSSHSETGGRVSVAVKGQSWDVYHCHDREVGLFLEKDAEMNVEVVTCRTAGASLPAWEGQSGSAHV